jgi:predicted DNA-binding transcriptional regulator YafY
MAYKHDYDKTLSRLHTILKRLNEGEALSVSELSKEFGVSPRTIQRDFNERLVNLYPIEKQGKLWVMKQGYKLEKTRDLEDELILDVLEKFTESIGGEFYTKAHKLLSKLKNDDFNPIYTKLNIEDITSKLDIIKVIEEAIKHKKKINAKYNYHDILISPLKIVNFEGFWYLVALDDDVLKKYYLNNISDIKISKEEFCFDEELKEILDNSISIWFDKDTKPFEVRLYATKEVAKYFKRKPLPTQKIISQDSDGAIEFSLKITNEMEILPLVKYWIPHLYIITPQNLKEKNLKQIQKFIENQKNI